jgi:hypothetical protein
METKNRFSLAVVVVMACLSFTACGGADITAPSIPTVPTPTPVAQTYVVRVVDALTGGPVLAASVNGQFTDSAGKATLTINVGGALDITRAGYCDRKTVYREEPVNLLSTDTGCDYEADIMYRRRQNNGNPDVLERRNGGHYTVSVDPEFASQSDKVRYAMDRASEVSGNDVTFELVASGGQTQVVYDSNLPAGICDGAFSTMKIRCGGTTLYKQVLAHEFGHLLGFGHTSVVGDLMYSVPGVSQPIPMVFSVREHQAWLKMAKRQNGNRWPDTDPSR